MLRNVADLQKKPASKLQGILKKPAASRDLALVPYQEEPEGEEAEQDDLQEEDEEEVQEQPQEEEEEEGDEVGHQACQSEEAVQASPSGPQPLPQGGQGPFGGRLRPLLQEARREAEAVLVEEV